VGSYYDHSHYLPPHPYMPYTPCADLDLRWCASPHREVADLQATVAELQAKLAAKDGAGGAPRLELM
jgi:hypothetical protein